MPRINPYSQSDPLWPEPPVKWPGGRRLAPLPKPPMPRDLEDEPANEKEPWIINPDNRPARPPKGDVETGQPVGPAFTKLPRSDQRGAVSSTFDEMLSNAKASKGSVFDTVFDKALRFGASDPHGGVGVVANPGSKYFQQLLKRDPKFAGGLQKVPEVTEYLGKKVKDMPTAWGVTSNLPMQMQREAALAGKIPAQGGLTQEEIIRLASRGQGATMQSFPGKAADETLFHEGLHALYSKKFPVMQNPNLAPERAQELIVRAMRRYGASDDEIIGLLGRYAKDPNHGLVDALARFRTHKTGGMSVLR